MNTSSKIKKIGTAIVFGVLMLGASLLIPGCASSSGTPASGVTLISVSSASDLNPDSNNRPSPLRIVIYELTSVAAFDSADFFALSQKDESTLGSALLKKHEFFINPGESNPIIRKLSQDASFIGVFADFRDIENAVWRARTAITATEPQGMLSASLSYFKKAPKAVSYKITADKKAVHIKSD